MACRPGGWSHLRAPGLTCLLLDAGCLELSARTLHVASPRDLGFLTTWWLGSKDENPERESRVEAVSSS